MENKSLFLKDDLQSDAASDLQADPRQTDSMFLLKDRKKFM